MHSIQLNRGADSARGDNAASLKLAVASWLNEKQPTPNPAISSQDKSGCGFYHDATAELICPVDFNWADKRTQDEIRNYDHNFQVTAHSWPTFMYQDGRYDREDPTRGLFKGALLVRTFKHIFTSPSSASETQPNEETFHQEPLYKRSRTSGERRTRHDDGFRKFKLRHERETVFGIENRNAKSNNKNVSKTLL
ncbi:uncharacterized protein EDB93DRAFT_1093655 [Suillus bovinus]|uniref:uncharacterized protein n=1 Tax=Suillus bovinus TaxID=48563 RepID=UPI001B8605E8|nr:uncharacterized protein EDB93DRAFT_1093655 [Suillus bovinus]KAG2132877.1 hypothetical protein EDB93DRAFT_1093655 [Suillus bovinus]